MRVTRIAFHRLAWLVAVAVTASMAGACGGNDEEPISASSTTTSTAPVDGATTITPAATNGSTTTLRSGGTTSTSPGATSGSTATAPEPGSSSTTLPQRFPSSVTVKKACINAGEMQTVTVKAIPDAIVTYVTSYADGESHEDNGGGLANTQGTYTDTYVIDPASPKGDATITSTAQHNQKGVSIAQVRFTVGC